MELILDTHAYLWHMIDSPNLPSRLRAMIENPNNTIYISIVSVWEAGIKIQTGKLVLADTLEVMVDRALDSGFKILMIRPEHVYRVMTLPFHHRDPFDRMIIAQGLSEDFTVASKDRVFGNYKVGLVWD